MNYAIILAGGIGSRFWPLSSELKPKQFLNVYSSKPMIEETIDRISRLIKKENIYIATNRSYNQKIKKCLKKINIPLSNFLFEPESKNTFAPIAVLSKYINSLDSDAVIAVLPCDHFIKHQDRLLKLLSRGIEIAKDGYVVSLGIIPNRPETGYGYIKTKSKINDFYLIEKFIEKPDLTRAKKFIKDGRYYWDSGIFIFSPQVILEEIRKFMPSIYKIVMKIKNGAPRPEGRGPLRLFGEIPRSCKIECLRLTREHTALSSSASKRGFSAKGDRKNFSRLWHKLPSISVDYAIMEKTKKMALLPADFGWIDLGSWEAIGEIAKKDKNGNIFRGKYMDIGSKNTIVWSDSRLVATLGLDGVIIVDTKDALLVCSKDRSQDVKKLVQQLKQKNYKDEI